MDKSRSIQLLSILIDNSKKILLAGFGLSWVESTFFDIIMLLRKEDHLKDYFIHLVRKTFLLNGLGNLYENELPVELIELVAHELRWSELLNLAQERIDNIFNSDSNLALGDISTRLNKAYCNNWEDREFYAKYNQSK